MTLDERIRKALRANSKWQGSPEELWGRISSQLNKEAKRSRQPLWLGTAAAAVVLLALLLHTVWNPLPPQPPEVEQAAPMRMLSSALPELEPRVVRAGGEIQLALDIHLAGGVPETQPQLEIWKEDGQESALVSELDLSGVELLRDGFLTITAPSEPGSYRLVVRGTVKEQNELYGIYAEETIVIEAKGEPQ